MFQRLCALHLPLWTAASLASAQGSGLCQLEGELLTPGAWCESNSLDAGASELLTPADWREQPKPGHTPDHASEREPELITPSDWKSFERAARSHVR